MARTSKVTGTFERWIEKKGVDYLAQRLDVHRATILHWKAGRCDPRVEHLRLLKRLSRGMLSYEQMIDRPTPTNRGAR